jgi:hypothetical protein
MKDKAFSKIFVSVYFEDFLVILFCTSAALQRPTRSTVPSQVATRLGTTEFEVGWGGAGLEPETTASQSGAPFLKNS